MPIVRVNGKQLRYWVGGKRLSDRGKTILFIHGSGGSQIVWTYQKAFFEKGFDPIVIELSGHGSSDGTGEEEIGKYAEEVLGFMRALGLSRVFVVGHSMGGAIAQSLALADPGMLKGIVLVGTGARLEILPGAGHMVMIEAPETFNERVGAFIRDVL